MPSFRSRTAAMFAATAALSLVATPVAARDWHRHRDNGVDGGDVFAGLLIVGGIAAIASAASSKAKRDRQAREDSRYRDDDRMQDAYRGQDYRAEDYRTAPRVEYGATRGAADTAQSAPQTSPQVSGQALSASTGWRVGLGVDDAVNACVGEVERGSRSIDTIDGVNREGQGWRVGGRVRGGYGFSCTVDAQGRVRTVEGL
jgi:Ni/Co efflux regulator RcnB